MFTRLAMAGLLSLCAIPPMHAGYYSTIDAPEEVLRYSRDFNIFSTQVMDVLATIGVENPKTNQPIRRRYLLLEKLAGEGTKLDTLEDKINYGTMLLRRNRTLEAMKYLDRLTGDYPDNFVVLSQYATALFFMKNSEFDGEARRTMKKALAKWPASWGDLKPEDRKFVEALNWNEIEFVRYRRAEVLFERLMVNRLKEKKLLQQKKPVEETVDPIFLDAKEAPIRFLNDKGEYEAGRIAKADKEQLPTDAVEQVEQLLIWMPADKRLLWLLGETLNASAMEHEQQEGKSVAVDNARRIFARLTNWEGPPTDYGLKEITSHKAVLEAYLEKYPPNAIQPLPPPDDDVRLTRREWWWRQAVVLVIGLAVGMFAIWQLQELRRRRQARARG